MHYLSPANFSEENNYPTSINGENPHRKINYDLCTSLDLTKFGIVLDKMVESGMNPQFRELYKAQAYSLLALLRSENNRLFGV